MIRLIAPCTAEIIFILSGLSTGVAVQLQWFTMRWNPYKASLYDFAVNGGWQNHQMTIRLIVSPILVVFVFYLINKLTRFVLFRFPLLQAIREQYLKYDKLLYGVFLLSLSGFCGFYINVTVLFVLFVLSQLILIYRLIDFRENHKSSSTLLESRLLFFLFFCSGFAALIYQIIWQRALFRAFGVNIESVTIIVSIFMFGMGVGSLTGGILSRKYPKHLPHLFVSCETIIGLFGFFSLTLISTVTNAVIHCSLLTVSLVTYGLLFIPTVLMGATLPILADYLYNTYQNVGKSLSVLYFINTLGAALACFATPYVIFLYTGLKTASYLAAFINFIIVYLGYKYVRKSKDIGLNQPETIPAQKTATNKDNVRYFLILFVSLAVGFVSLSQEILWIRLVSFTTAGKATVFPLVLGFFLFGIALGSLKAKKICEKHKDEVLNIIAAFIIVSALSYYLLVPLVGKTIGIIGKGGGIPLMFLGIGGIAFLTGAVLPMLSHYAVTSYAHVGFSISWLYTFNILGSTAGSLFTGFFLLNWFTIEQNILFISIFYFIFGAILWIISGRDYPYKLPLSIGIGGAAILLFLFYQPLYFNLLERLYHGHKYSEDKTFKYESQSRHGIINVIKQDHGDDIVIGGGAYDGRFNTDLVNNNNRIDRAYMLAALHLKPRKVLQIGLSSASWAKVITNHKEVESLDIVEINPRYSEIIQEYPEQKLVLSDPKIHIYFDDGRRWLKRHPDKKYDFILMNTTFHWRDQANNLLSKDFLELCKEHLNQGGAIYYNTTYSIDVPYTAAHVFNYISRYSNFIAASDQPFPDDPEIKINNLLKFKYHGKPITEYNDPQLRRVLDRMASADTKNKRDEILKMAEFSNLITDDNLASEFKTSRKPYCPSRNWLQLLKGYIRDF